MARVQCFDCDMPVVVDPNGRCPEGHDLGPVGERIEQSLGRAEPHPDEPQPWVAVLDADEVAPEQETRTPRAPRPISVGPEPSEAELNGGTADGLLQELHALNDPDDSRPAERARGLSIADPTADGTAATEHDPSAAATTPATPDSPAASGPWEDWEDWNSWTTEEGADTSTHQQVGDIDGAPAGGGSGSADIQHDADDPWNPASEQDAVAAHAGGRAEDDTEGATGDTDPAPLPRRAPTVRSEESLSDMAELAALLNDDGPAPAPASPRTPDPTAAIPSDPSRPPAPQPPGRQPPAADETTADVSTKRDTSRDHLATVSQLPVRPHPSETDQAPPPPPPSPPSTPQDEAPTAKADQAAGGGSLDWSNFTSKGRKRRFGR